MILFFISFVAGVLTVLAPCVLPLLPVIVGGSIAQGTHRRAYTICIALGVSVTLFTLLLKVSTVFINIPPAVWQYISAAILVGFGLVMIFPQLWDTLGFVNKLNIGSNKALARGYQKNSFFGDVLMGAALGPVFASCSPTYFIILATVLPASFAAGMLDLLAYAVGLSGFLLIIALAGQKLVDKLGVTIEPTGWFRRGLGVLFLIVGLLVGSGLMAGIEAYLLEKGFDATRIEQRLLGAPSESGAKSSATSTDAVRIMTPEQKALVYQKAHELVTPDGYINTDGQPITLAQFKGKKVVLIDIWTYSCINCQRTLPYVKAWYDKYHDQGLEIIGLHTPEFSFEHVYKNVADAVARDGIKYPVVLDNEYQTWNAYGNQFWPRKYLIDIDGYIVYDHAGEGNYDETEKAIRQALDERAQRLGVAANATSTPMASPHDVVSVDSSQLGSPETYFGAARNEYLGNGTQGALGLQSLSEPVTVTPNTLYLIGEWNVASEYAETASTVGGSAGSDRVDYRYRAKNVYFVAGSSSGAAIEVEVLRDSKSLDSSVAGTDIYFKGGRSYMRIDKNRLYNVVKDATYGDHFLEFIISRPGLQAYTFTFG